MTDHPDVAQVDDAGRIAIENTILRGLVGSTAHGSGNDGEEDRDEMGVFIEPPRFVCGLTTLDHFIYRDQPEGVRSGPGDLDLTLYSLRKYCRLALQGNPSILILLWSPEHVVRTPLGDRLIELRESFASRDAGARFLGYLVDQKEKLRGMRSARVTRPELVERYGYDTKFAMHALRLGYQGCEFLRERRVTMPVPEPQLSTLRAVRSGRIAYEEAILLIEEAEARLRALYDACRWVADERHVTDFLVEAHRDHWRATAD